MDLKGILKTLKLNEGTISTILGVVVVLAVGFLIINYFKGLRSNLDQKITSTSTQNVPGGTHTVAAGETLWSISEKYYQSGYNWTDIAEANNLKNPGEIEVGQTLIIPKVEPKQATLAQESPATTPEISPSPTAAPAQPSAITAGTEYTVVKGDHLWGIAVRTYGDGYQWVKIWRANKQIKNPNLIFVDQKINLPQ
ncbi:LysM peptidoglycan-binding domain-containing protein [Candidatus Microgenomates bacterium]|nr:LysM peptidoglycan-binding domain-containing protein [Candidatus Microgenomates bacterium]